MGQVPFQELGARTLHGFQVRIAGGFAVIQPGQEFQLRQQVIGRRPAVDLQAEGRSSNTMPIESVLSASLAEHLTQRTK